MRWLEDFSQECDAVFADFEAAKTRAMARRYCAILASTNKLEDRLEANNNAPKGA